MNQDELKLQIGANITLLRKRLGMTQAELAGRLSYSDKAVSKWERGESVPDVITLAHIAEEFGVTVNDLVYGPEALPPAPEHAVEEPVEPEKQEGAAAAIRGAITDAINDRVRHNRKVIQGLVTILVWIVVLAIYVLMDSFELPYTWLIFLIGIPANAITLLSMRCAWRMYSWNLALISIIMWGCLVCLHVITMIFSSVNIWRIYLMGGLGQAAICLWFMLVKAPKEK